jgi:Uma2 family endonuclease
MSPTTPTLLTLEDYLELEKTSETRHEFVDGVMVAMAGGKRCHHIAIPCLSTSVLLEQVYEFLD